MVTVGLNFTKISAEKKHVSDKNIKVNNNVGLTNVSESTISDPKKSLLKFEFSFICRYEPELGHIALAGELIEIHDKDLAEKILASWNKDKQLSPDFTARIFNQILSKANIEAIVISRELGLPPPIAMPKLEVKMDGAKPAEVKTDAKAESKSESKPEVKKDDKKKK